MEYGIRLRESHDLSEIFNMLVKVRNELKDGKGGCVKKRGQMIFWNRNGGIISVARKNTGLNFRDRQKRPYDFSPAYKIP